MRDRAEAAAQAVIDARNKHLSSSLADLYDPLAMPRDLVEAHQKLNREVLTAYGLKASATESEVLAHFFTRYSFLTANLFTEPKHKKSRKAKQVLKLGESLWISACGTPQAQHVSGQEWTGVDTLTTDRENMRN